ncbi:MAG: carbohydrate kinase family protein [Euryarchaeota archaeon]|nr:carbohydrate kinase family protein [Euryarchaeota archaeon]
MDVVSVGHASVDLVRVAGTERRQLGGAAIYSALAAKIFSRVGVVTRVGADFPAEFYSVLRGAGVDTSGIRQVRGRSTSFEIEYDGAGQAHYRSYQLGVGVHLRPGDIPERYLTAKAFHIAPMAASKQRSFLEHLREHTYALVSLNTHVAYFQRYRRELLQLIGEVDIFTINDEEAMRLTGTRSLEHAINALKKLRHNIVVVTMGVYGSIILEGGEVSFSPSVVQRRIVDLTGCGDAFAGAFVASYLSTDNAVKAANIANSVAAINASDWYFRAIARLRFQSLEAFQEFVVARQRRLSKNQRSLEHFIG